MPCRKWRTSREINPRPLPARPWRYPRHEGASKALPCPTSDLLHSARRCRTPRIVFRDAARDAAERYRRPPDAQHNYVSGISSHLYDPSAATRSEVLLLAIRASDGAIYPPSMVVLFALMAQGSHGNGALIIDLEKRHVTRVAEGDQ